jgi:hypothetical protein
MTVLFLNTAEGGVSGDTVTQSSSGLAGSTAFSRLNTTDIGSNCTFIYDNTSPYLGTLSYRMTSAATSGQDLLYYAWPTAAADFRFEWGMRQNVNNPTPNPMTFASFYPEPSGASPYTTPQFVVQVTGGSTNPRRMRVRVANNSTDYTSTFFPVVGTWYTFRLVINASSCSLLTYAKGSETVLDTIAFPNPGGYSTGSMRMGIGSANGAWDVSFDNLRGMTNTWEDRMDVIAPTMGIESWVNTTGFTSSGGTFQQILAGLVSGKVTSIVNPTTGQAILSGYLAKCSLPAHGRFEFDLYQHADMSIASGQMVVTLYKGNTIIKQQTVALSATPGTVIPVSFAAADLTAVSAADWGTANLMKIHLNFTAS